MEVGRLLTSIAGIGLSTWALVACSDAAMPPPLGDYDGSGVPTHDAAAPPPCSSPAEGCPCDDAGAQSSCGVIYRVSGTHVDCSNGYLTCQADGTWSACQGPTIWQGD